MSGDYYLVIKGRDGVKRAEVVDMLNLAYTRRVNAPGIVTLDLAPEHHAIAELELDGQVEIWHQDRANGIARSCDFRTLLRGTRYRVDDNGDEVLTATCVGQLHLLSRRIVAYPAHTTGISSIAATRAETVMRTLVATNCTDLATVANGRARDGAITGVSVEPDEARGNVVSWSGPWKNVLGELQDLARPLVGGGDFDLLSTGPQTWVFRFYPGQLGTDRSTGADAVTFSRAFDNMATPDVTVSRVEEKTVAIVGGQGEEDARQIAVRTGPDYTAADAIETFVDARNAATLAGLETAGDRALDEARSRPTLTFTPLQTPRTLYRKHYFLGDLVRARYRDLSVVLKVVAVTTTLGRDGDEQIVVELAQP